MEIIEYRLHKRPENIYPTKTEKIEFKLYFSNNDTKILLDNYDFNKIPFDNYPGSDDRKYHKLFIEATINTLKWGGEEDPDEFEQFIYFNFIHLGTDVHCENPKIVIENKELKSKLYYRLKGDKVDFSNYSNCIINNTNSSCSMLDFLKITVADKIT